MFNLNVGSSAYLSVTCTVLSVRSVRGKPLVVCCNGSFVEENLFGYQRKKDAYATVVYNVEWTL